MEIKYYKLIFISLFTAAFLFQNSANAGLIYVKYSACSKKGSSINWEKLNLNRDQQIKIKILDQQWQKKSKKLTEDIIRDKKFLKTLLTNPFISDSTIKNLQKRILANQKKLRFYAMENFLQKRAVLYFGQRQKLHEMFLKY